jgi:hypothetical protein
MIKKYTESIDLNYRDYEYHETIINTDKEGDKYTSYIFKFNVNKDTYYVSITFFDFDTEFFTVDFQIEEDFIQDNLDNKDCLSRTYTNTNKFNSFLILSTVFKIIYDFYIYNKEILHSFSFVANDDKRHNIYKNIIRKNLPNWEIISDEKDENDTWHVKYKF